MSIIKPILVLGASGYIGSQLVSALLEKGYLVRASARSSANLKRFSWAKDSRVETIETNVLDKQSLQNACQGCDAVYYLIHSMNSYNKDFSQADRLAAKNMIESASSTGVRRIIYLGGLGEEENSLSKHLRSRMEVLYILHSGKVPVTSLRAAMIIGKGSISFEIFRSLINRFPILITPTWVSTESQPIAVTNVIHYLAACLGSELTVDQVFDIGGPDILSYEDLVNIYTQEAGLKKRRIITLPILTSTVSSFCVGLVTPYPMYIARPLVEGLKNRVVCQDNRIGDIIPQNLLNCQEAIRMAISL